MQKTLRKPENWQYFESLCKKLWGELWEIPHKIKKNGRLGQPQNGVDVYGIPKNENEYWGIQCKGKNDDYLNSKLTNAEIDEEIKKAKTFSPKLKVFIIATTQSKDVGIEQYIREKDIENRAQGSFEIILLCWEDIVDLIEENRETLNWYLGINSFRDKYDFEIVFSNGTSKTCIKPKFLKSITKYRTIHSNLKPPSHIQMILPKIPTMMFQSNEVNRSWCSLDISLKNIGNVVLENWYVKLKLNKARKISDNFNVHFLLNEQTKQMMYDNRTLYEYKDKKEFLYEPVNGEPLIQKSGRTFTIYFIPEFDQKMLKITWELLARDFNKTGLLEIELEPEFKEEINYIEVDKELSFKKDKVEIKELIEERT
ncbi:hypothetical protein [Tenacibaculum sp.]|uniref:hypothetical protein n=1 Tax=Tenacibaculum sp. TaxID=1906242 RepID=UPI003AA95911